MTEEQLTELEARIARPEALSVSSAARLAAEVRRLRLALRILAGLPDDAGVTHAASLGDRHAAYARGVLLGAEPGDVAEAVRRGEPLQVGEPVYLKEPGGEGEREHCQACDGSGWRPQPEGQRSMISCYYCGGVGRCSPKMQATWLREMRLRGEG